MTALFIAPSSQHHLGKGSPAWQHSSNIANTHPHHTFWKDGAGRPLWAGIKGHRIWDAMKRHNIFNYIYYGFSASGTKIVDCGLYSISTYAKNFHIMNKAKKLGVEWSWEEESSHWCGQQGSRRLPHGVKRDKARHTLRPKFHNSTYLSGSQTFSTAGSPKWLLTKSSAAPLAGVCSSSWSQDSWLENHWLIQRISCTGTPLPHRFLCIFLKWTNMELLG